MGLRAIFNLSTGGFECLSAPESESVIVEIGFCGDERSVVFDDISFGWEARVAGILIGSGVHPEKGVRLIQTDQPYISADLLIVQSSDEVEVVFWAVNGGVRHEGLQTFVVPRLGPPYTWSEDGSESTTYLDDGSYKIPEGFTPPPHPDDGKLYIWNMKDAVWYEAPEGFEPASYEVE